MRKIQINLEYTLPIVLCILVFLVKKNQIQTIIYILPALVISLWFFPIRWFFQAEKRKSYITVLADFVLAALPISIAIYLWAEELVIMHNVIHLLGILNFGFLIYFYLQKNFKERKWLHFLFLLLIPLI
jgi:hypothetical protein